MCNYCFCDVRNTYNHKYLVLIDKSEKTWIEGFLLNDVFSALNLLRCLYIWVHWLSDFQFITSVCYFIWFILFYEWDCTQHFRDKILDLIKENKFILVLKIRFDIQIQEIGANFWIITIYFICSYSLFLRKTKYIFQSRSLLNFL